MNSVIDIIKNKNNFVVLTHINPDGDAIGSSLGMYNLLKKLGKNVDIVINEVPSKFSYLSGFDEIITNTNKVYDYAIIVDTATKDRINTSEVLDNVKNIINIDHHISNSKYGYINYIEDLPACCQIIYNIVRELDVEIDDNIGLPIANGIITDTGGLSHMDVLPSTYKAIYELSRLVDVPYVFNNTINKVYKSEFDLKKIVLDNLKFYKDNKITYSFVTEEDIKKVNGTHYDAGALVNIIREIDGVYVAIFTKIFDDGIRISLRSNNIDVNKVANKFNGGGHVMASGISLNGRDNYEEVLDNLIKELDRCIDEWDNSSK